jgi:hypothetical protein
MACYDHLKEALIANSFMVIREVTRQTVVRVR